MKDTITILENRQKIKEKISNWDGDSLIVTRGLDIVAEIGQEIQAMMQGCYTHQTTRNKYKKQSRTYGIQRQHSMVSSVVSSKDNFSWRCIIDEVIFLKKISEADIENLRIELRIGWNRALQSRGIFLEGERELLIARCTETEVRSMVDPFEALSDDDYNQWDERLELRD